MSSPAKNAERVADARVVSLLAIITAAAEMTRQIDLTPVVIRSRMGPFGKAAPEGPGAPSTASRSKKRGQPLS